MKIIFGTLIALLCLPSFAFSAPTTLAQRRVVPSVNAPSPQEFSASALEWQQIEAKYRLKEREDYTTGLSYVISGALAIAGGFVGQSVTNDPIEKGVYSIFQTVGIASIGYGAYTWKLGGEDRMMYETVSRSSVLDERDKVAVMKSYLIQAKDRERRARIIRAVTHGLIAAYNIYNATKQDSETMKNTLYFVGGVNLLASVSYTF